MTNNVVIRVENLGKRYRLSHHHGARYNALRDVIADRVKDLFSRRVGKGTGVPAAGKAFWALKGVSFEIRRGEVVGIIGRNGAGKSTLLKVLSQITEPTEGRVGLRGRVASLLEVGSGFHPELTGRENIYLNGAILGMARAEIRRKFDEIVAFAEVEKFLDTPVKRYSSGMYVRLAFAVAAHLEPDILIVDEVLAVGDAEFQKKCLGKIERVASGEGRTVLFVSHNMAAIERLCSSAIHLSQGRLLVKGDTRDVVQDYMSSMSREGWTPLGERHDRQGTGVIQFTSVSLADGNGQSLTAFQCGTCATLVLEFENTTDRVLRNLRVAVGIDDEHGQRVLLLDSALLWDDLETVQPGTGVVRISMPRLCLLPRRYSFTIFATVNGIIADWIKNAGSFDVEGGDYFGTGQLPSPGQGLFVTEHTFQYEQSPPVGLVEQLPVESNTAST